MSDYKKCDDCPIGNWSYKDCYMCQKDDIENRRFFKKQEYLENHIIRLCKLYTKLTLDKKFLIKKGELERNGLIFGDRYNKLVTEIRIRQWSE